MNKKENESKNISRRSTGNVLFLTVGSLLALVILSVCLTSWLYAKYNVSDTRYDSARVAKSGIGKLEVWEHEIEETEENSGVYKLLDGEDHLAQENEYKKVLPGVDIPKDPFIRLEIKNAEVNYFLYMKVTESAFFPETVTYKLTDEWEKVAELSDEDNGVYVYKYKETITPDFGAAEIKILKEDKLFVGEHFLGEGKTFTVTFSAYLEQVRPN